MQRAGKKESAFYHITITLIQVLRSASSWSVGQNFTEDSIHMAYLSMIANAKHYIYIENQFFVSLIGSGEVHNEISKVLCDRIVRAHE